MPDKKKKNPVKVLPKFNEVISLQSNEGCWNANSWGVFQKFIVKPKDMNWINFKNTIGIQDDVIASTLLALCIMETFFSENASELVLIEKKAKFYLSL